MTAVKRCQKYCFGRNDTSGIWTHGNVADLLPRYYVREMMTLTASTMEPYSAPAQEVKNKYCNTCNCTDAVLEFG